MEYNINVCRFYFKHIHSPLKSVLYKNQEGIEIQSFTST